MSGVRHSDQFDQPRRKFCVLRTSIASCSSSRDYNVPSGNTVNGVIKTEPEAFTRASRLTQQAEFRRVFARPRVSQDRYFRVLGRANGMAWSRLGLAVSVKVCKRATGRNRLKRIVRESFRRNQANLGEATGIDMVVLPSHKAATMCNKTLFKALDEHWKNQQRLADAPQEQQQGKN